MNARTSPTTADQLCRLYGLVLGAGLVLEGGALLLLGTLTMNIPTLPIPMATGDTRHNVLHIAWGVGFLTVLLTSRSYLRAARLMLVFGVFYTALGFAGIIFDDPFGLRLGIGENAFHFTVGLIALALAISSLRPSPAFLPTRRNSERTIR